MPLNSKKYPIFLFIKGCNYMLSYLQWESFLPFDIQEKKLP